MSRNQTGNAMSKKTKNLAYVLAAIAIVLIVASPKLKLFNKTEENANAVFADNSGIPIAAYVLEPQQLNNKIFATGTIVANEEVELRSEISGKITRIHFQEGSRVKKGDLLVKINDAELQAQLEKQKYQKALLEDREYRQRMLLKREAISQEEYDLALNELNKVKAEIVFIEAQISKTEIHAPFDGVIGLKYVSEGSYISPSTKIANLIDLNPIKIDFSIPEKYANAVQRSDEFTFKIVGAEKRYRGQVLAVEPKIDPATRTLQLRGISPNEDGKIVPGAFAEVELILQKIENALMVPTVAVVPELQGQKVYVYKNGKAVTKWVETGIRTEEKIQILSGIQAGDTVITSGILQLRPDANVRITTLAE
jgi:membrane fusion protein (multidrug efflux system)